MICGQAIPVLVVVVLVALVLLWLWLLLIMHHSEQQQQLAAVVCSSNIVVVATITTPTEDYDDDEAFFRRASSLFLVRPAFFCRRPSGEVPFEHIARLASGSQRGFFLRFSSALCFCFVLLMTKRFSPPPV